MSNNFLTPFFPVYSIPHLPHPHILHTDISAILGGSDPALQPDEEWPRCGVCQAHLIPYIQINLASPRTPEQFRHKATPPLAPAPAPAQPDAPTPVPVLQVFVCADDESAACFEQSVVSNPDGTAWLVRVVQIARHPEGPATATGAARARARAEMGEDRFFLPERVVSAWTAGTPEVEHEEVNLDVDEAVYAQHAPAEGLKLLGWPIRGKFYTSKERCPAGEANGGDAGCKFRSLMQLGTYAMYDEEKDEAAETPILTCGNTWINQCERHPGVLAMAIGGDW